MQGSDHCGGRLAARAQQGGEFRSGERLDRVAEDPRERGVAALHPAVAVEHRDPFGQGVECGLPFFLAAPHHLDEPGVGEDHRGVGRDRREEAQVFGRERPGVVAGDPDDAERHPVRPERGDGGGPRGEARKDRDRRPVGGLGLDVPRLERLERQPFRVARHDPARQVRHVPLGPRHAERATPRLGEEHEGPLGVQEAQGITRHLLADPLHLERVGEHIAQFLEREQLPHPSVELESGLALRRLRQLGARRRGTGAEERRDGQGCGHRGGDPAQGGAQGFPSPPARWVETASAGALGFTRIDLAGMPTFT